MKKIIGYLMLVAGIGLASQALADSAFCAGFAEGYKSIKGEMVMVPMCPMEPLTPMGSTPFREGIKAGIRAAQH